MKHCLEYGGYSWTELPSPTDYDVAVTAVDPGFTDTELTRNMAMMKSITRFVVYPLFWPVMKKARTAAQTVLHAALAPELQKSKGDYYV